MTCREIFQLRFEMTPDILVFVVLYKLTLPSLFLTALSIRGVRRRNAALDLLPYYLHLILRSYLKAAKVQIFAQTMSAPSDSESAMPNEIDLDGLRDNGEIEKLSTQPTQHSRDGQPVTRAPTAQDWTGPDDPENPINWPMSKRVYHTIIPGLFAFTM